MISICRLRKNKKVLEAFHKFLRLMAAQKLSFHKNQSNNQLVKAVNNQLRTAANKHYQWEAVPEVKLNTPSDPWEIRDNISNLLLKADIPNGCKHINLSAKFTVAPK